MPKAEMYSCCICRSFASLSFSAVIRHIGNTHAADSHLSIICPVPGCSRENPYTKYESFRSHVYRKHREILDGGLPRLTVDETARAGSRRENAEDNLEDGCDPESFEPQSSEVNLQSSAARFLLKTREITQAAVDGIVHDVTDLWHMGMKQVCMCNIPLNTSSPWHGKQRW